MSAYPIWQPRPVFITSTFRDMHAERDYLHQIVFPELEERLKARFHHLEPIDLRWGVATLETGEPYAKELLILKVCLEEIERSRPFLVGLLGDRYGWMPPPDRVRAAAQEMGLDTEATDKSVTALEIEFGIFATPEQRCRYRFYFRKPLPYRDMAPEIAGLYSDLYAAGPDSAISYARSVALRARILKEMPERVGFYGAAWDRENHRVTGLEAWGRQVLEDLWEDLLAEIPPIAVIAQGTWQEQERFTLEQFVDRLNRDFVGRDVLLQDLLIWATGDQESHHGQGLVGEPGIGKSALFAQLNRMLSCQPVLLLAHAAGVSPRSKQVDSMLLRWIEELAAFLKIPNLDPEISSLGKLAYTEKLANTFQQLLFRATQLTRVICLIDSLNQFEHSYTAQNLTWLPTTWPDNARLLATSVPGSEAKALQCRSWIAVKNLNILNVEEVRAMARALGRRYHKDIAGDLLDLLAEKKRPDGLLAGAFPLWLQMAVEELLLLDEDDFIRMDWEFTGNPEHCLHQLLLYEARHFPPVIEALYGRILWKTEKVHGKAWPEAFVSLMAVTRSGLRESDLQVLLPQVTGEPWEEVRFAHLRRSFRAHLSQKGAFGQWDFNHAQMRQAVINRNLGTAESREATHREIVRHLEALPAEDNLRQSEFMFHLIGADDRLRAARYFGKSTFDVPYEERHSAAQTLEDYLRSTADQDANPHLEWVLSLLDQPGLEDDQVVDLAFQMVENLFPDFGPEQLQLGLLQGVHRRLEKIPKENDCKAIWQRPIYAIILRLIKDKIADLLMEKRDFKGALKLRQESLSLAQELAHQPGNPQWQDHLSHGYRNLGYMLQEQGDLDGAFDAYMESLQISQRLAAMEPSKADWQKSLSTDHLRMGDVLCEKGNFSGGLMAFRQSLAICQRLAAADPEDRFRIGDMAVRQRRIGDALMAQGDFNGALAAYQESLAMAERAAALEPTESLRQSDILDSKERIGQLLRAKKDFSGALSAYRDCLALRQQQADRKPYSELEQWEVWLNRNLIGDVLLEQGDLPEAMRMYRENLAMAQRLAALDSDSDGINRGISMSLNKIGDVLIEEENLEAALKCYRESLEISQRLAAGDPEGAAFQQGLAESYIRLAGAASIEGNYAEARQYLLLCLEKLRYMQKEGILFDRELKILLSELEKI